MSEKQLLTRYQRERATVTAAVEAGQARLVKLDAGIEALQVLLGVKPAAAAVRHQATAATGTKALILDVLATATEPMRAADVATACKVKYSGNFTTHLAELAAAGDITRVSGGRGTRYRLPDRTDQRAVKAQEKSRS